MRVRVRVRVIRVRARVRVRVRTLTLTLALTLITLTLTLTLTPNPNELLFDALWSDPHEGVGVATGSARGGYSIQFGPDVTRAFCKRTGVTSGLANPNPLTPTLLRL